MNQRAVAGLAAGLALILGVIGAVYIAPPTDDTQPQHLQQFPQPRELTDFTLTDHHGNTVTPQALKGQWTLAFLGYTFCPDICPTTMAALSGAYPKIQQLESDKPVKVWFISVDPNRDTTARLNDYVSYFNEEFTAVSGEHAELFPLVRSMGMMYAMAQSTDDPNYLVNHSASVVLINPDAKVIGRFKPVSEPGTLAVADVNQILADLPVIVAP
ncbi:SCO family protein [Alteromonas sp. H39]|uniref:SCO family protein n=1 Tax=Alteromonas sp. H39 TaxID=3389876 RepID=UPI0039DFCB44